MLITDKFRLARAPDRVFFNRLSESNRLNASLCWNVGDPMQNASIMMEASNAKKELAECKVNSVTFFLFILCNAKLIKIGALILF